MIKYTSAFVSKLEKIITESGLVVRYERGNFQSGWCLLEQKSVVVLNKFLDVEGKIQTLMDLIPQLKINFDKLTHESQKIFEYIIKEKGLSLTEFKNSITMMQLSKKLFGTIDGKDVNLYTLSNGKVKVAITNYGGIIQSVEMPDKHGKVANIVAGFNTLEEYVQKNDPYFGAIVGRYANRIANGKFELDGVLYTLPVNNGPNSLHGGLSGFDKKIWNVAEEIKTAQEVGVVLTYTSKDGEEGYPGNVAVKVTYTLDVQDKLTAHYEATTDKATPINLTNHSYFNLTGFESLVLDHKLCINSTQYTVKNEHSVPLGEIEELSAEHPLSFSQFTRIGNNIDQFPEDRGFDHNYVLTMQPYQTLKLAAELREETSGRVLKVYTDKPGLQIYTANWWDGTLTGPQGVPYQKYGAIALETQSFPNSPNVASFPSTILKPNELYATTTVFELLVS